MKLKSFLVLFLLVFVYGGTNFAQNTENEYYEISRLIYERDLEGVKEMIESGTDVNIRKSKPGATPLIVACGRENNDEIISYLISSGADINARDRWGKTPLLYAAENSVDALIMLLNAGAKVKVRGDVEGMTPMIAATFGYLMDDVGLAALEILADNGADVNAALTKGDAKGFNPLLYAAVNGKHELLRFLLSNGAKPDHRNAGGKTALMLASREGHMASAQLLLDNEARVDIEAADGSTALSLAEERGHDAMVALLKEHGAE